MLCVAATAWGAQMQRNTPAKPHAVNTHRSDINKERRVGTQPRPRHSVTPVLKSKKTKPKKRSSK